MDPFNDGLHREQDGSHGPSLETRSPFKEPSPPVLVNPRHAAPPPDEGQRLFRLLWVFAFLLIAFLAPTVIGRIQYAFKYNSERAEADAALETLQKIDMSDLSLAFRTVAKSVGKSVVHIRTTRVVAGGGEPFDERRHFFGDPRPHAMQGQGSGVIIDEAGYIVTNNHVVENAEAILVQLNDGREVSGEVVGTDPLTDIAVLKIDAPDLIAQEWGDSDKLDVGSMVWAVGSPFGLQRSITFGIVSAIKRRGVTRSLAQDFLQTDAAVNPGNSGGPLVNINGKVVGINTAIVGPSFQGISFAIPSNTAREIYEKIREEGKISRGWLGVALAEVRPETRLQLHLRPDEGVLAQRVLPNSPADKAGLESGDIILTWDGVEAVDPTTLSRLVAATEIGSEAKATIIRNGKEMTLKITVAERPPMPELR